MHGWERLSSLCGMGCKVLWTSWSHEEKVSYDSVNKDDNDVTDSPEPVTSEPQKPVWADIKTAAPIVRNKSGSVGNIKTVHGYEKLSASGLTKASSLAILSEKRNSKPDFTGSVPILNKSLLKEEKNLSGSRASLAEEVLEVREMVTTV